jgi:hypothetical protein
MIDITLCKPDNCPVKEKCKRWDGNHHMGDTFQSYFVEQPGKIEDNIFTCEMFWELNFNPFEEIFKGE